MFLIYSATTGAAKELDINRIRFGIESKCHANGVTLASDMAALLALKVVAKAQMLPKARLKDGIREEALEEAEKLVFEECGFLALAV